MEINMQEWDEIKPSKSNPKIKIELALIDLYNSLGIIVPHNHQEILDLVFSKLISKPEQLEIPFEDDLEITKLRVQANSPYNDGWTKEFYEKELKRYNAGTKKWPVDRTKEEQDFMYNWIRSKSGK